MDTIIKNGIIITALETYKADIGIKDGKIVTIASKLDDSSADIIDASGKYVLPGAIDGHTHLQMPFGGTVSSDSYEAGTRAAACGGTTTVFDFAIQQKGHGLIQTAKERDALCAPQACVDYAFHVVITDLRPEILDEFQDSVNFGVPSFKVFMVYKKEGLMADDGMLYSVLKKSKEVGAILAVHAENPDLIDIRTEKFLKEGKTSAWYHYLSRPEFVEAEADKRAIHWAKQLDAPLYIVHLANKEGMEEVKKARDEGYEIYAETCPQYLYFTNEVFKREDGRNFVCSPPMKGQESQDALWKGIKTGDIATIATDHCPFQSYEKDWGKDDFTKIPNGCAGIENMYPYMLSEANKGRLSFNKVVEICSTNPAKIYGCAPQKGSITIGGDADIVIYDPTKEFTISQNNMHSDSDHTIWEGVKLKGYPFMTFSRGKLVYKDGEFLGKPGWGKFLRRKRK
ncbi:MAG: dihydropyrimidinase [Clostridium tyrobutyricum]|uniref:dihydropyrimidinase n=1 Tax=Clostridium tyrobutyricum TaxID=1519 RepID=UPI00057F475B|nr:dihydropyrimidinase [Clostridium tyrobutyricum]MBR9647623.1 dihydropyrimidinase [Clostridium tyrobutyricum]MBV4415505.1 dihydropyrimidinase [Clostridium tyrobutyricum]MBV4430070.1 dihydropyrimidinase [Clostridium tyrobutyricum]MBV4447677.1 dihydropyrimidinase [Clostridium tyrobutyricum]MCH4237616.1 dihydropyrimidinase [Clostridium tyrobutyricum]